MATANELLTDSFGRVRETVHEVVAGLSEDQLAWRADDDANSVAWLIWHLTRIQDDHVADAAHAEQIWTSGGWVERFRLPFDVPATGYGQTPDEAGKVRAPGDLLTGYYDAVYTATLEFVHGLAEDEFGRIVDAHWDPPVTLLVRLVSVVNDTTQHAGQAAYVRGLIERLG
ncbi:MAG: mycothiol transferase [Nocardioidaceae bacterium]